MMFDIKILIADDHPLFLRGIVDFLRQLGFSNIVTAKNGLEALQKLQDHHPVIAILDIEMPYLSGIEIAQKAQDHYLSTKIILLSYHKDYMLVQMADELNISGYLIKEDTLSEIEKCIRELLNGNTYFSQSILNLRTPAVVNSPITMLTPTEKKVLRSISKNMTSKEIAKKYSVSIRTIEKHRSNIIEKLGLDSKPTTLLLWSKKNQKYL